MATYSERDTSATKALDHLEQSDLGDEAQEIIANLASWLSTLLSTDDFKPLAEDFQKCFHPQVAEKIKPLLVETGFLGKVQSIS